MWGGSGGLYVCFVFGMSGEVSCLAAEPCNERLTWSGCGGADGLPFNIDLHWLPY